MRYYMISKFTSVVIIIQCYLSLQTRYIIKITILYFIYQKKKKKDSWCEIGDETMQNDQTLS